MLSVSDVNSGEAMVAVAPSGERTRWTEDDSLRSLPLREQGFYEIREAGAVTPNRVIAVNPDPSGVGARTPSRRMSCRVPWLPPGADDRRGGGRDDAERCGA